MDTPEESVPACVAFCGHLHGRALRRELWDLHCGAALDFFVLRADEQEVSGGKGL